MNWTSSFENLWTELWTSSCRKWTFPNTGHVISSTLQCSDLSVVCGRVQPEESAYGRQVGTLEQRSVEFLSPNSFSTMAFTLLVVEVPVSENPTTSLRFRISEKITVSLTAAQLMDKDCKHRRKKQFNFEVTWTRTELTAVYWKHLSGMPPGFVDAGDVKRSAGGFITTIWNGYSVTYRTGHDMLQPIKSIFSPPCILGQFASSMALIGLSCACKHTESELKTV